MFDKLSRSVSRFVNVDSNRCVLLTIREKVKLIQVVC